MQLNATPTSFASGRLSLKLPETMWVVPAKAPATMLSVYDAKNNVAALTLSLAIIPAAKALPLSVMRSNFSQILQQRLYLAQPLVWSDVAGVPPRSLSHFFKVPAALQEPGYPAETAYGLVKMQGNDWALLNFTLTSQSGPSRALYLAAVKKVFASVRLGNAKVSSSPPNASMLQP